MCFYKMKTFDLFIIFTMWSSTKLVLFHCFFSSVFARLWILSQKLGFDKGGPPLALTNLFDGERSHVFTTTTTTTQIIPRGLAKTVVSRISRSTSIESCMHMCPRWAMRMGSLTGSCSLLLSFCIGSTKKGRVDPSEGKNFEFFLLNDGMFFKIGSSFLRKKRFNRWNWEFFQVQLGIARSYDRFMASSDPQQSPMKSVLLLLSPVFCMESFMILWIPNELA